MIATKYNQFVLFFVLLCHSGSNTNPIDLIREDCGNTQSSNPKLRDLCFSQILRKSSLKTGGVINYDTMTDMKLFKGTKTDTDWNLLHIINRCRTTVGGAMLAYNLATPTNDIDEVKSKQETIRYLNDNAHIKRQLNDLLKRYSACEQQFMDLYDDDSTFSRFDADDDLVRRFYFKGKNNANDDSFTLGLHKLATDSWHVFAKPYFYGLSVALTEIAMFSAGGVNWPLHLVQFVPIPFVRELSIPFYVFKIFATNASVLAIPCFIAGLITSMWSLYRVFKKYSEYKNKLLGIVEHLGKVKVLTNTMRSVNDLVKGNSTLSTLMSNKLCHTRKLLGCKGDSTRPGLFLKILDKVNFKKWRYLSIDSARILALFKIFCDNKNSFCKALCELGNIDATLSMVDLFQEYKGRDTQYCFVDFLDSERVHGPYLEINGMWSPFVRAKKIITNHVLLGHDQKNIILCGHNGCGKSTYINNLVINASMAQAYGIMPARNAKMTVFDKILTFTSVSDDIATSDSLYMVELNRFKRYIDSLKFNKNQLILAIFDEPMHGTDSRSAIAFLKGTFKYVAKNYYNNVLQVISTHYREITDLERLSNKLGFRNYKMCVKKNEKTGRLMPLFTVIPGIATYSIALDLAKEKDLDTGVMKMIDEEYLRLVP